MSRLDEECIMAVVRNRSGFDSGNIDYHLIMTRFERMSIGCLEDAIKTLDVLRLRCIERIGELEKSDIGVSDETK